ncbi:MAG: HlyC/CorC family transporter [Phycisphaerae bacterium]|nr:HlyC/CorC family transporter [Phycisphaerae bacterium]
MELEFWIVCVAAVGSLFFALSSFALRDFSRAKLEDIFTAGKGSKGRKRLELLDSQLKPLQLTLSLCRSLGNLVLVGAMVMLFADTHPTSGKLISAIIWSGAIIAIFGVGIPHAWANYAGERIISGTFWILIAMRYLLFPVVFIMQAFDLPIRRLSGQPEESDENGESAKQEILQAAADGAAEGLVDDDEVEMIESVIEFSETDAAEIMTPRTDVFALSVDTPWVEAVRKIHTAGHTRVPIYEDNLDNIVGVVYAKDLLKHIITGEPPENLQNLSRKPFFVPESKPLDDLLREFKSRKVHIAVVLDEYGGTAGLVSIEDVIEEIVGDISDEYDHPEDNPTRRINETTVESEGRLRIDELNDMLELKLPEDEDYDTVAGFVVAELGYIPAVGETVTVADAKFTILESDERKISRLRIEKLDGEENGE